MTSIIIALLLVIPIALYARREWEFEQAWRKHAVRYMLENADLYDKLSRQIAREKWHKYPDEKPLIPKQEYLTYNSRIGEYDISFWLGGSHWDGSGIAYWSELPEPPEEEK